MKVKRLLYMLILSMGACVSGFSQDFRAILPKEGQIISEQIKLQCNSKDEATNYLIEIYDDLQGLNMLQSKRSEFPYLNTYLNPGNYFWRVFADSNNYLIDSTKIMSFTVFSPIQIDSLYFWVKADTSIVLNNGFVSNWNDLSASSFQLNQSNTARQPAYINNELNGYPFLGFDASDDQFLTAVDLNRTNFSISSVYNVKEESNRGIRMINGTTNWIYGPFSGIYRVFNGGFITGKNTIADQYVVHTARSKDDTVRNFVNGVFYGERRNSYLPGIIRIGSNAINGNIGEIIITKGMIHDSIRQNIDLYLMDKYAPPVNLGPDRKVCSFPDSVVLGIDYALDYQWSTNDTTDAIQIDSAGKYYVTITDMFERISVDSIYFSLDTTDYQLNFSFEDTTLCEGDTILLRTQNFERYSYNWNTTDTTASIAVADSGQYILSVQNCLNNTSSDTIQVNVNQPRFSLGNDTIACFNEQLSLQADSAFSNVSYLWSNNQSTSTIIADTSKLYRLKVTDSFGCEYVDSILVEIDSSLFGLSLGPDTSLCAGNRIGIQQSTDTISSYLWSTSDTTALLEVNSSGNYHLTVSNGRCQLSDTVQVSIQGQAPQADFSSADFCFMDSVNFTDLSLAPSGDTLIDWKWSFGDQDSAFVPNPVHQYAAVQSYQVLLQVETDKGCIDTAQRMIHIRPKPVADFATFASCSKEYVYFADSSIISSGNIIGYSWNFGDTAAAVNTSNQPNPRHVYDTLGQYTVQLITESAFGCRDTVRRIKNINPTPNIGYSFNGQCLNDSVSFSNSSITAGNTAADNFLWIIDGLFYTEENPSLRFLSKGKKEVFFRITTDSSCSSTLTDTIEIYENPNANFAATNFCAETPFLVQDQSSGPSPLTTWRYILNGDTLHTQNPTFTVAEVGNYELRLKVIDTNLCSDSTIETIRINPKPNAAFDILNNGSGAPYHLLVTNNSTNANAYLWKFGNGDTAHTSIPSYTYDSSGIYQIRLIASNDFHCIDSVEKSLSVLPFYLDALVEQLALSKTAQNYLSIQMRIVNAGRTVIDDLEIEADVNGEVKIVEKVEGPIFKSKSKGVKMNASVNLEKNIEFVCVNILKVNGQEDAIEVNNSLCEAGFSDELILNVFPNPTDGQINFEYVLPKDGEVKIQLYDQLGKEFVKREMGVQEKGYYFSSFYLSEIKSGIYHYKITYGSEEKTGTFIKQR